MVNKSNIANWQCEYHDVICWDSGGASFQITTPGDNIIPYHIMPCHTMLYSIISYYSVSYYVYSNKIDYNKKLQYIVLYYIMLYVMKTAPAAICWGILFSMFLNEQAHTKVGSRTFKRPKQKRGTAHTSLLVYHLVS